MTGMVRLEIDGAIATIINDNSDRHNAFDDAMDGELFDALDVVRRRDDLRVAIWRGVGPSFSSGRDVGAIDRIQLGLTHLQLMQRVHDGALRILDLRIPMIAVLHGWTMGVSFQRALLADIRIAATDTRFRLPEISHGFIPDAGGVARLSQMCGHGVASDLVLTGRTMDAEEALHHGIVSRLVEPDALDAVANEMAAAIAAAPPLAVKMARHVIAHLNTPAVATSMAEEMITQSVISTSDDYAEMRRARREQRPPIYRGT